MITINNIELDAFVDFQNGFKFIVELAYINKFGNLILEVNPKSLIWVDIEHSLNNPLPLGYDQFLAECDEAEEEFWKELYEEEQAEYWIEEYKNIF